MCYLLNSKTARIPARTLDDLTNVDVNITYIEDGHEVRERATMTSPIK